MSNFFKKFSLGFQHFIAMFGANTLIALIIGFDIPVAVFASGIGTLAFHLVTKGKVPAYMGSSAAYVAPLILVSQQFGIRYAYGGVIGAGIVYIVVALIVRLVGIEKILRLFPPIISGCLIMIIGLTLMPIAIDMSSGHWIIALITLISASLVMTKTKGYLQTLPVLIGMTVGYIVSIILGIVDFSVVLAAPWFAIPNFTFPAFSLSAMLIITPFALVALIEHVGDIKANSSVVGKDFTKDPGLHRTIIGDGLASIVAGLFGGPTNTTYSENTGVLAITKQYDPALIRIAAVIAMILPFIGKFAALINSIPTPVMGGISIVLFGMIASVGLRTLIDNRVDLQDSNNLLVVTLTLAFGLSGASLALGSVTLSGMSLAALIGVFTNFVLNRKEDISVKEKRGASGISS